MCVWNVKEEDRLCKCCRVWGCPDRPISNRNRNLDTTPVYRTLMSMDPGDEEYFELEKWPRCRSTASKLKSMYGVTFSVGKVNDKVLVIRTS
jgi:hypothetical protein